MPSSSSIKVVHPSQVVSPVSVTASLDEKDLIKSNNHDFIVEVNSTGIHSFVTMSDDGAEVTLQQPSQQEETRQGVNDTEAVTPESIKPVRSRSLMIVPQRSLLDDEPTPSPTPDRRYGRSVIFGCDGSGCYKPSDSTNHAIVTAQYSVERTICSLLGSPVGVDDWCSGWQAWSYFEVDATDADESVHLKENVRRVLRNRVSATHARSKRITTLKRDLQPFDVSPEKQCIKLTKTLSFSSKGCRTSAPRTMSEVGIADDDSFHIHTRGLDSQDHYYDSDPEETTRGRTRRHRVKTSRLHRESPASPRRSSPSAQELPDLTDEGSVQAFVQEIINDRFTLILHPNAEDGIHSCAPVAMTMWVERGQQLSTALIQPKLVWRQQHRKGDDISNAVLHRIELLDIVRILELGRVDRKKYPLAHPKKSFLLETLNRKVVFEASSEEERNRLVMGLKSAVARFGAKIITEDETVFMEYFFTRIDGPGDMPEWIRS